MLSKKLSERLEQAFIKVPRVHFMPTSQRQMADCDTAFPIGYSQTISQPTTVRHMLLWLEPRQGQSVLDVGSGSGWSTALLAYLVGPKGRVYGVERIPQLKQLGENNCRDFGCSNVQFSLAGEQLGLAAQAPYDRILVSAAAKDEVPDELVDQLAPGGKLVIPVDYSIIELQKDKEGNIAYRRDHDSYVFVPLIF